MLEELQPQFERTTQHKPHHYVRHRSALKRQIDEGAAFDVTILTPPMLEDLAKNGKVETGSVVSVAKTGIGLAARKRCRAAGHRFGGGAQTRARRKIGRPFQGRAEWRRAVKIMERLGIAEEMKPRIVIETRPGGSVTAVVERQRPSWARVGERNPPRAGR